MTEYLRLLVVFFAAVNPAAVVLAASGVREGPARAFVRTAALGLAVAAVLYVVAVLVADSLLDFLDVAPETFRIAAGIVMATAGVFAVWRARVASGPGEGDWRDGVFPLGIPLLAGPSGLIAALSYGADEGAAKAFFAAAPVLVVAAALLCTKAGRAHAAADAVARLTGALLVVIAAGLIVEGVRDI
ncbi:MAG: MarC family protein [Hyphomicrobiales bacterium]